LIILVRYRDDVQGLAAVDVRDAGRAGGTLAPREDGGVDREGAVTPSQSRLICPRAERVVGFPPAAVSGCGEKDY